MVDQSAGMKRYREEREGQKGEGERKTTPSGESPFPRMRAIHPSGIRFRRSLRRCSGLSSRPSVCLSAGQISSLLVRRVRPLCPPRRPPSVSPAGKSTSRLSLRTKHSQPTRGGRQIRQGASETQKGRGRDGNQDTAANAALLIRSNGEAVRCSVSGHDNRIGAPTQLNMKLSLK